MTPRVKEMMRRSSEEVLRQKEIHDLYRETQIDMRRYMDYMREVKKAGREYGSVTFDEIEQFIISCPDLQKYKERWEEHENHRKNNNHSRNG